MSNSLALFAAAALMTVASPGPTSLLALNNGTRHGLRGALPGVVGAALSDLALIVAVALGLGAVVATTPWALAALRWAGVGYLAWLSWQLLRTHPPAAGTAGTATAAPPARGRHVLARSFLVAVGNPKGYLFFLALLPTFIDPQAPALRQYASLALVFATIDAAVLLVYAGIGALGLARAAQPHASPWFDRLSGLALLGMALALAAWQPPI
ncbi:MAG: LysE family translocator [Ottowia sp.]|nr:LysE family translocator [Rhodoferax sp.]MCB2034450.1 LysE family translocator [Ottowia sp.]MCB2035675.1 LysE family translocator [Ottowia sp.]MCB2071268.1 LysE family translocator [Ottowia sp.]